MISLDTYQCSQLTLKSGLKHILHRNFTTLYPIQTFSVIGDHLEFIVIHIGNLFFFLSPFLQPHHTHGWIVQLSTYRKWCLKHITAANILITLSGATTLTNISVSGSNTGSDIVKEFITSLDTAILIWITLWTEWGVTNANLWIAS